MPGENSGLSGDSRGRLGSFATVTGIGCMAALVMLVLGRAGSGDWGRVNNRPGIAIVGVSWLWLAPVWLICAGATNVIRRERPMRRRDIALLLGVLLSTAFTVAALRW